MSEKMGFFILKNEKLEKDISGVWPLIDMVSVLVCKGDKVLTVYNEKWAAFTLPMSKLRKWKDPKVKDAERTEEWEDAAVRTAVEWLGCTMTAKPERLVEFAEFQQSDRDERWKRYHVQAYTIQVDDDIVLPPSKITEWLLPAEITDESRRPISPTARHIMNELVQKGLV